MQGLLSFALITLIRGAGVLLGSLPRSEKKRSLLRSRHDTLRELQGLRGSASFETVLYMTMAVGDTGATGWLKVWYCEHEGREERGHAPNNRRTFGKTNSKCSLVCRLLRSTDTGIDIKRGGDFACHYCCTTVLLLPQVFLFVVSVIVGGGTVSGMTKVWTPAWSVEACGDDPAGRQKTATFLRSEKFGTCSEISDKPVGR